MNNDQRKKTLMGTTSAVPQQGDVSPGGPSTNNSSSTTTRSHNHGNPEEFFNQSLQLQQGDTRRLACQLLGKNQHGNFDNPWRLPVNPKLGVYKAWGLEFRVQGRSMVLVYSQSLAPDWSPETTTKLQG